MSQTRTAVLQSILLLVILSLVATPAVAGVAEQPATMEGALDANVETDSDGAGGETLAGETVNLHVSGGGGDRTFSFDVTENERIEDLERGAREDATVEMHTDQSTFEGIAHAPDPERKFQTAVEQGDVEMRGADAPADAEWDVFDGVAELADALGLS